MGKALSRAALAQRFALTCSLCSMTCSGSSQRSATALLRPVACKNTIRPFLFLRGGGNDSKRPGTVDYSIWDDLSSESAEAASMANPRVVKLKEPSDVTLSGSTMHVDGQVISEKKEG